MEIKRDLYLKKLIDRKHNGMIKIVTGVRRCGKSYLMFNLFSNYLRLTGVDDYNASRCLNDRDINYVCLKFHLQKEELRCYTRKQSHQQHWNS